ncbi:MAG: murein biosynthesis integral membrane protein MurJ [Candidatus Omnitrophota bacterium]|jgi:putative peptidoglycan lipid II flippase|nr:murein biosynthesis integral membrane protein MurJ [Candidatus Omnitrophota bacterium]MDD5664965.1 murein biosynthesis integral membrane protein MurJ [Candidatus Omnitrophota bacterium]
MSIDKDQSNLAVAKSAGIIGLGTFVSRLLGFVRDVIIARLFGVYLYAQVFVIAFKIPNLFRDFVGEGATNAAFVPIFSEYKIKHSKDEFWELANVMLNILLVILMSITVLGIIFSPFIVRLIAPGFLATAEKFALTVKLNRIIFPYILLISLAAYATALLNSLRHFAVPAFAPCLLNISIIIFALIFGEGVKGLALGVLTGGVLQLVVQIPVLYKKGFRFKLPKTLNHPGARAIRRLMLPRILSSCIYQVNNFVDSIFGSLFWIVGEGGVAVLYFSYRLIQFPLGIFSNAISQAILPTLSRQAIAEDSSALKQTLSFGLRAVFFVMLPAGVFLMVLAGPLVNYLFFGGKFDAYSARLTSEALFFYGIGLSAYGANKVLQSYFFSMKDTLTPAKVSALGLALNIVLNIILMFPLKIAGIALATSISGVITFCVLFLLALRKAGDFGVGEIKLSFLRILASSLGMGAVCYFSCGIIANKFLSLIFILIAALFSYVFFCFIFRVKELRQVWGLVKRK